MGDAADPNLFRGFLAGNAFRTKKGAKGIRLDSLWSRQLVESFLTDDEELALIALGSCIADETSVVEGGQEGSPFCIGNYGFYTDSAFDAQGKVLQENERVINEGLEYLSEKEWKTVDGKLRRIAEHGKPKLRKAVPGDTLPMVAVRARAFSVATLLFTRYKELDALISNDEGETLKDVLREYNIMATENLLELNKNVELAMKGIVLPSTAEQYIDIANKLMTEQTNLQKLLAVIIDSLMRRLQIIDGQKWELKKATLRKQTLDYDTMCSISLEPMALEHIELYKELIEFVGERINRQNILMQKNDLKRLVSEQQELLVRVRPVAGVTEQMFGKNKTPEVSVAEDEAAADDSSLRGGDSMSAYLTDVADMSSVASVEMQVRDILSEQLISIEEEKERRRNEKILAAENASSKFYLTHDYLEDGHKIFEAVESLVPHADRHIPTVYVKESGPGEIIMYK